MKSSHFFDIDTILTVDNKVWIIDKNNPNIPIMKISQSDFNLIRSGIYRSQNSKIDLNGKSYYFPKEIIGKLKIKCKNHKSDISNLSFSMQEFLNKEVIENIDYDINLQNIIHLKNTNDDIYFICSKNNKINYETIIKKIEDKLKENGLIIKNYYFISETFFNRNEDDIAYKKVKLLIQHLIGFKTNVDKFIDEPIDKYDEVRFYDDDTVALYSFAMPQTEKNLPPTHRLNRESIPQWISERICVLQICEDGDIVDGVGQKVSDRVFYVIE